MLSSLSFWAQITQTSSNNTCFGYQIILGQETLAQRNPPTRRGPKCQHQRLSVVFCFVLFCGTEKYLTPQRAHFAEIINVSTMCQIL